MTPTAPSLSVVSLFVATFLSALFAFAPASFAAEKKKKAEPEAASAPGANACGCFADTAGVCRCSRKSKCGCPGECEPAGCEDKRQKEMDKEAQQEVKRQQDAEKKRNAELEKKKDEQERTEAEKGRKRLRGGKPEADHDKGAVEAQASEPADEPGKK